MVGIAHKGARFDGVYLDQEENGKLVYAGKVKHGFDDQQVKRLQGLAAKLKSKNAPIAAARRDFPKAQWLKPQLLADVEYRRKTRGAAPTAPVVQGAKGRFELVTRSSIPPLQATQLRNQMSGSRVARYHWLMDSAVSA